MTLSVPVDEILSRYQVDESGCWIYTGPRGRDGYGKVKKMYRSIIAHRFFYENLVGPIPEKMLIMHTCDVRPCVNPNHLVCGTHADNMADMKAKGRGGAYAPRTPLTDEEKGLIDRNPHTPFRTLAKQIGRSRSTIKAYRNRKKEAS